MRTLWKVRKLPLARSSNGFSRRNKASRASSTPCSRARQIAGSTHVPGACTNADFLKVKYETVNMIYGSCKCAVTIWLIWLPARRPQDGRRVTHVLERTKDEADLSALFAPHQWQRSNPRPAFNSG